MSARTRIVSANKHFAVMTCNGREVKLDATKMEKSVMHPLRDTSLKRSRVTTGGYFVLQGRSYGYDDVEHTVMFQPRDKRVQCSQELRQYGSFHRCSTQICYLAINSQCLTQKSVHQYFIHSRRRGTSYIQQKKRVTRLVTSCEGTAF